MMNEDVKVGQEAKKETVEQATLAERAGQLVLALASNGASDGMKVHLDLGADVTIRDERGMTALHHAAATGSRPCIRLLVATGRCDYLIKDNLGRYAYELAFEWGQDYAIARLLAKKQ